MMQGLKHEEVWRRKVLERGVSMMQGRAWRKGRRAMQLTVPLFFSHDHSFLGAWEVQVAASGGMGDHQEGGVELYIIMYVTLSITFRHIYFS